MHGFQRKVFFALAFVLAGTTSWGATVTVGSTSGTRGSTVSFPIDLNPGTDPVVGLQFDLTLPATLSTGTVTPGAVLNTSGKQVSTSLGSGNVWRYAILSFGNTSVMPQGNLLTAQVTIGAGTPLGSLPLSISNVFYSDANGSLFPASGVNGSINVLNSSPTVAAAAGASPSPVMGSTTTLTVLGADDAGEPGLTYTWATTGTPPAPVTFSVNGTNAAKTTVATFTRAGSYSFTATLRDTGGLTVTSSVNVTVNATLTTITVSPTTANVIITKTQQFTATAADQFGTALATQPTFTWTASGGGAISTTGLFTAGSSIGGPFTITAASGGKSGTASVTVINAAPTVATAASASPSPVTGSTTTLTVLGADDAGEPGLTYTWATTGTPPAPVTFTVNGTNAAKTTVATFTRSGSYSFTVTLRDAGGLTVTSSVNVTVNATLTSIVVAPSTASVIVSQTQTFTGTASDQFGIPLASQPAFTWTTSGGGTISATGLFTAGTTAGGPFTITAASGGKSGTASVTVINTAPTVATAASASPSPVTGSSTTLTVLGADDAGEPGLTYTWATTGTPPASVAFSLNGTNAAKTTVATFTRSGSYSFTVTLRDVGGLTTTSSVNVTVNATLTSIVVTPPTASVIVSQSQTFTGTASDQFGIPLASQPAFTWTTSGGGTISATGLFTAGTTAGGPFTITAANGGKSGSASVTVVLSPCDLNRDGLIDVADVVFEVNGILTTSLCILPGMDLNVTGLCDVGDAVRIVNVLLGGSCVTGP